MDIFVFEQESTLTVVNARTEFGRAATWLHDFIAGVGLPDDLNSRLLVVLDEVLSNVVNHALAGAAEGNREIRLRIRLRPETVELEVIDDGPAFDPTAFAAGTMVVDRRLGGAGLLFVRALMDEVRFIRQGDRNCLTLCKRLAATG
jgi:anti-sigma regulatory factor (Ser/Thr protein kinase)